MKSSRIIVAALVVLTLLLGACASGGDDSGGEEPAGSEAAAVDQDATFSIYNCEPTSLLPTSANEICGTGVLDALFTGLVRFDPDTHEPVNAVAESIESDDLQTWTVTIGEGWTFHDGTPVTAQSFVDAWNYGAYGPNAQANSYVYGPIEGFDDLQCEMDDEGACVADPAAEEMSGLEVIDDHTLEITLAGPYSQFPLVLGTPAFYPLPEVFFEDPEAFNEAPVGNGPFMMDGQWEHDQTINVVRYDDYPGDRAAKAAGVEFRIYSEINTAYTDLIAGNLDVMADLPPEQVETAEAELGDRFIRDVSSSFSYLAFPLYDERFSDVNLRRAFSMALDRETIVETLVPDVMPATGVVSPVVAGAREDACGQWCTHDPEEAKRLLEEAGGWEGPLELWFNAGAGHEQWMEAAANQFRDTLGIEDITFQALQPPDYAAKMEAFEITGPFRLAWVMDYPSMENYLLPLFSSAGGSNLGQYSNEEVDAAIVEGNLAKTPEDAIAAYQRAEDLVIEDLPVIPLFFGEVTGGHSERVSNVSVDAFARVNVAEVEVVG